MTLEEAIECLIDYADGQEIYKNNTQNLENKERFRLYEEGYRQLADWLKELKAIREYVETLRNFNTHNCYIEEIKNIVGRNDE